MKNIVQVDNIKNSVVPNTHEQDATVMSSIYAIANTTATSITEYSISMGDSTIDNDYPMSCSDRICAECGNDHCFRANFEDVVTSIDSIPELLSRNVKEVLN